MLLGFKRQFANYVEDGSKTHSIRHRPAKVGEILHCYVDPRQRSMRLLGRFRCCKVERIFIDQRQLNPDAVYIDIRIEEARLSFDEKQQLAWADGFRERGREFALVTMMRFWEGRLPFAGYLNHWEYRRAA